MRGFGRVFKRGSIYWVAYFHHGKEYRESSRSEDQKEARELLKKRIGDMNHTMELTRFDLKNQAIQERIAVALERIAGALERQTSDDLVQAVIVELKKELQK